MIPKNQVEELELNFRVQLGRSICGSADFWSLTITDDDSHTHVLELNLTDAQLGALLGCHEQKTTGTLIRSELHGLVHHNMEYTVDMPKWPDSSKWDEIQDRVELRLAREKPGWRLDRQKRFNGHNYKDKKYHFIIRRWVEKE